MPRAGAIHPIRGVGAVVGLASFLSEPAAAAIVFDNGSFSGTQVGRYYMDPFIMYEDFTLTSATTITGLAWSGHDRAGAYSDTTLTFFDGSALPSVGTQIFSTTVAATRTPNLTGPIFGDYEGFDYEISGLSLTLGPGLYYFSLLNDVSGALSTWDEAVGTGQTIAGRWQESDGLPVDGSTPFHASEDLVFQLVADGSTSIPEPATLALFGAGLAGLAVIRRRRKAKA